LLKGYPPYYSSAMVGTFYHKSYLLGEIFRQHLIDFLESLENKFTFI